MNRVAALLLIAMVAVFVQPTQQQFGRPGGLSLVKGPTTEVRNMVRGLQSEIEDALGKDVQEFYVISHKTQVVAGIMYYVKIQDDTDEYAHVKIFRDLRGNVILNAVQPDKTFEDEIVSF